MEIRLYKEAYSIVKTKNLKGIDMTKKPLFLAVTSEEISVVLPSEDVNFLTETEDHDWCFFQIQELLDFSLVGIIADISQCLAEVNISIFVISTYNTDYFLVKKKQERQAVKQLSTKNYTILV